VKKVAIYLGLGSNLGNRQGNLDRAIQMLAPYVDVSNCSAVYDTAPVGNVDQPRFLNMVCKGKTDLSPADLLGFIKQIENQIGRKPGPINSPRPIDIDILFYNKLVMETPILVIPHPRLVERAFVLAPLADIAPTFKHPVSGKTIGKLLHELKRSKGDAVAIKPIPRVS
jgi:2-amino-4-hydroxy-6-hydroxymethyldihydropteridine diphosphokinase